MKTHFNENEGNPINKGTVEFTNGLEPQPDGTYKLSWLVGIKYIEPIHYWLEEKIVKRWFWFDKKEYYLVCEFCRLGPMTLKEANYQLRIANVS